MITGSLRRRVRLQRKFVQRDSVGAEIVTWLDEAVVWGAVEPMLGREFLEGKRLDAELTTRIRIRYREGVEPTMRAVTTDNVYDVVSVQHVRTERRELVLMCREVLE